MKGDNSSDDRRRNDWGLMSHYILTLKRKRYLKILSTGEKQIKIAVKEHK